MDAPFNSYADIAQWYTKVRSPAAGRPASQWGRVIRDPVGTGVGGDYYFYVHRSYMKDPFAVVKPDNTITFLYTGSQVRRISNTLTGWLWRVLPFHMMRVAKCRYNIVHHKHTGGLPWWQAPKVNGYAIFSGIVFDLTSGVCLNPKVIDTSAAAIDTDKRKQWLRDLKRFKKDIKVRARLGLFESIYNAADFSLSPSYKPVPDWTNQQWLDLLEAAISKGNYSSELLQGIARHAVIRKWNRTMLNAEDIYDAVDDICKVASLDLRLRYGVIKETDNG